MIPRDTSPIFSNERRANADDIYNFKGLIMVAPNFLQLIMHGNYDTNSTLGYVVVSAKMSLFRGHEACTTLLQMETLREMQFGTVQL